MSKFKSFFTKLKPDFMKKEKKEEPKREVAARAPNEITSSEVEIREINIE